jgi:hypothetical protein
MNITEEHTHERTIIVKQDMGYADYEKGNWVDDWREVEICKDCEAYRLEDGEWIYG